MSLLIRNILTKKSTKVLSSILGKRNASTDLLSNYTPVDIPEVPIEEHVFEQFNKFPHHIATVSIAKQFMNINLIDCIVQSTFLI